MRFNNARAPSTSFWDAPQGADPESGDYAARFRVRAHARPGTTKQRALILRLVDQRALLDPRHHVAELGADFFDRVRGELGAGRLERGLVDLVLQHPVAG